MITTRKRLITVPNAAREWTVIAMGNKRNFVLKRRDTAHIPAEKLLSILRGIYPKEMAQEVFEALQRKGGDDNAAD